jgi:hypothetical protein
MAAGLLLGLLLPAAGSAQHWRALTPAGDQNPSARAHAAAIFDPVGHRMVIFGGRGDGGTLNDIWALDLNTTVWTELTPLEGPAPAPRSTPAGVYDDAGHQMVIWSGQNASFYNDVWAFDLSDHTWTELTPTTAKPNIRYGVAAVFDPSARSLVTFAGFTDQGRFDDTWILDLQNAEWNEVTPASGPERRCLHTASYDARRHRMIMYGGQRSGALDDLWAFDLSARTWTELTGLTPRPSGRYFAASVYDVTNDRVLVFGGNRGAPQGLSDAVWSFTLSDNLWHMLSPSGTTPAASDGTVAVYVESEDRVIVFGGRSPTYMNDIWSLDLQSSATAAEPGEEPSFSGLRLYRNYPNPVTATTTIEYEVPYALPVKLTIYDLLGREVKHLVTGVQATGRHAVTWDGRDAAGRRLATGLYLYELLGDGLAQSRWLVLANPSSP